MARTCRAAWPGASGPIARPVWRGSCSARTNARNRPSVRRG
nr:MAG TPA: hypothetical protein [Caudoviricetes sp.]